MYPAVDSLVEVYRDRVRPRMSGLPMYNGELEVEGVGFSLHDGRLCGVLLTPWFMNLVLLSGENDDWSVMVPGNTITVAFPEGEYAFMLSAPEGIAPHLSLPLFTTVLGFTDQDTARRVATEVLERLYRDTGDAKADGSQPPRPKSRREFLRGWLPLAEEDH